jgi:hypothetical protein
MLKFIIGTAFGALLAFASVRLGIEPPGILKLPERLKGNLVATAVEEDLYDLDNDQPARTRALAVYFKNRASDAAKLDETVGHPFLNALYRTRATREARTLAALWMAYDEVLAKPELRRTLETKHDTSEDDALKRAMLLEALANKPFLTAWLARDQPPPAAENIRELVDQAAALNR